MSELRAMWRKAGCGVHSAASTLSDMVTVMLGGSPCAVLYAGLVSPGLYQVNLQIPDIPAGDQTLVVSSGYRRARPGRF
jgi:uncharacterized protein (TIGR03437 family)